MGDVGVELNGGLWVRGKSAFFDQRGVDVNGYRKRQSIHQVQDV